MSEALFFLMIGALLFVGSAMIYLAKKVERMPTSLRLEPTIDAPAITVRPTVTIEPRYIVAEIPRPVVTTDRTATLVWLREQIDEITVEDIPAEYHQLMRDLLELDKIDVKP